MFKFHRVGWVNEDHEEISGWLLLVENEEQLSEVLDRKAYEIVADWIDIKESPEGKSGHTRTQRAAAYKEILQIHMEREGKSKMSMSDCIAFMEKTVTSTIIDIFNEDGQVYWNAAGGCRGTHLRNDHRGVDEEIFEKCTNKDLVFPCLASSAVDIKRWPGGKHFYITVNGTTISVNGFDKFNTVKSAEEAKELFIKRNRFKNSPIV